jgi:hypothetical protein
MNLPPIVAADSPHPDGLNGLAMENAQVSWENAQVSWVTQRQTGVVEVHEQILPLKKMRQFMSTKQVLLLRLKKEIKEVFPIHCHIQGGPKNFQVEGDQVQSRNLIP